MRIFHLPAAAATVLILAACTGGAVGTPDATRTPSLTPAPTASPGPTNPPTPSGTPVATTSVAATPTLTAGGQRIEVRLTEMTIEPAAMVVQAGQPVTFVVTNDGLIEHEFFLGDEEAQAEHEAEMAAMGGMTHDEPGGIAVHPGATKELTFTFPPEGTWLAGCHVPGHYPAGMWATITINP